jgi:amino acid transporter
MTWHELRNDWIDICNAYKSNSFGFYLWLAANVGGLLILYFAIFTIKVIVQPNSNFYPGPHEYLIVAAISVAVSGVSYTSLYKEINTSLNPLFIYMWGIILALIYGVLITFGVRPAPYENGLTWVIAILIFIIGLFWSSITWLHEKYIRMDLNNTTSPQLTPPADLSATANTLSIEEGVPAKLEPPANLVAETENLPMIKPVSQTTEPPDDSETADNLSRDEVPPERDN